MAMNYWFHPPDGDDFTAPYSSDFWPNDFVARFERCSKADMSIETTHPLERKSIAS
jgi:hypothetical protein